MEREETHCLGVVLLWNHGMVWVGRVLEDHLFPAPCHEQEHIPLHQLAQNSVHPYAEHSQREMGHVVK